MGVCGSGVAAWARPGKGCVICGGSISFTTSDSAIDYTEYYGVPEIDGYESEPGSYVYSRSTVKVVYEYGGGGDICLDCLENLVNEYKASQPSTSGSTQVTAEVASTYSIIVPQAITLDGSGQSGTYSKTFAVTVKGDIGENQQVTVTATPPTMKCAGCADVAAAFTAGYKTTWNRSEAAANSCAGTAADYTVSATLTPGEWTGTATFACSLGGVTETPTVISFTLDGTSYQAEEGMTWGEWIASENNTIGVTLVGGNGDTVYLVKSRTGYWIGDSENTSLKANNIIRANESYVLNEDGPVM